MVPEGGWEGKVVVGWGRGWSTNSWKTDGGYSWSPFWKAGHTPRFDSWKMWRSLLIAFCRHLFLFGYTFWREIYFLRGVSYVPAMRVCLPPFLLFHSLSVFLKVCSEILEREIKVWFVIAWHFHCYWWRTRVFRVDRGVRDQTHVRVLLLLNGTVISLALWPRYLISGLFVCWERGCLLMGLCELHIYSHFYSLYFVYLHYLIDVLLSFSCFLYYFFLDFLFFFLDFFHLFSWIFFTYIFLNFPVFLLFLDSLYQTSLDIIHL